VHSGTIPIALKRLAVIINIDAVLFTKSLKKESGNPDLVCGSLGALTEDLELPLSHSDLGVDALVVNASVEAEV